jgi:hypothetical protein
MQRKHSSKLEELMIVNPGAPGGEESLPLGQTFLGEDGRLYRLKGWRDGRSLRGLAEIYLGEDGALYRLESLGPIRESPLGEIEAADPYGCYFLGEDGTLYQAVSP